ncbi:MAG TPA: efflux RND transporter periplasmic adaptor subunit [Terriglobia bacterium]|nr:efflux RND transporter periplasmic adaptor subunit [Terriglobia bacterium]
MAETKELEVGKTNGATWVDAKAVVPTRHVNQTGMKKWKKVALAIVAVVAFASLAIGGVVWSKRGVVTVQTGKVQREDLAAIVTANGEIKPVEQNQANVNANSTGKITEILVKEGDHVTKGQLLMRTEDVYQSAGVDAQQAAVTTAQADLAAQEANVLSAKAALDTAQADLAQAVAKQNQATDNFKRGQELFKDKLLSQQDFDTRLSDYRVAQTSKDSADAKVGQAKAQYQQALFNRDSARAKIGQSKATLVGLKNQLAQTVYNSPLDGYITSLPVHLGENVVPGIQNAVGSLLYQVSNLSIMTVEVKVDETDIPNVKLGQTADVQIDAYPNKTFKGHVTQIGESAVGRTSGTTSGATATTSEEAKDFKVVVVIDDPPPSLRPGLSATAKVTTATRKDAVAVPIQAVTARMRRELEEKAPAAKGGKGSDVAAVSAKDKEKDKEELQGVFVIKNGRAEFVQIESGIMSSTDMEITKGIQPGDVIVTGSFSILRTLKNHTKVSIENTPAGPPPQET